MATARDIIETLGGSATVASATGFPLTTIEGWKDANFIPAWRQPAILALASKLSADVSTADFPTVDERIPSAKRRLAA